jgi:uncharacterized membrane protein YsdA (DUF1294 family)
LNVPWLYLVAINSISLLLMGLDKLGARVKSERVPELVFFLIALGGGFLGILFGMLAFHHKVSKVSFQFKMLVAAVLGVVILSYLVLRT